LIFLTRLFNRGELVFKNSLYHLRRDFPSTVPAENGVGGSP
jgi:hypothetical protein